MLGCWSFWNLEKGRDLGIEGLTIVMHREESKDDVVMGQGSGECRRVMDGLEEGHMATQECLNANGCRLGWHFLCGLDWTLGGALFFW